MTNENNHKAFGQLNISKKRIINPQGRPEPFKQFATDQNTEQIQINTKRKLYWQ